MAANTDILTHVEGSEITIRVHSDDYYASKIAHAVEDCDSHLLGLRIADSLPQGAAMTVVILVNRRDPAAVVRSLERYGYEVIDVVAPENSDEATARERALELLHYLEI